jgi:hypothetical protein
MSMTIKSARQGSEVRDGPQPDSDTAIQSSSLQLKTIKPSGLDAEPCLGQDQVRLHEYFSLKWRTTLQNFRNIKAHKKPNTWVKYRQHHPNPNTIQRETRFIHRPCLSSLRSPATSHTSMYPPTRYQGARQYSNNGKAESRDVMCWVSGNGSSEACLYHSA